MNSKQLAALERLFAAEVGGRLPLASRARVYRDLEAGGMVQYGSESKGRDRFGDIVVSGYYLTHKGRMAYCETCR